MSYPIHSAPPFDLVVFGGTGDLARRKLYPALFRRFLDGQFDGAGGARVVGASRQPLDRAGFQDLVAKALLEFAPRQAGAVDAEPVRRFLDLVDYVAVDAAGDKGWDALARALGDDTDRVRAFYLATAPELFGKIAERLARFALITPAARVIVEKPLGKDAASAAAINDELGAVFEERQIFRIDHYLGKEAVQNLMALRFANTMFEPLWTRAHIDHVQITAAETVGVENRGPYYDRSGALRDMVQNHLLQLVCVIAMEPPNSLAADAVRDEKRKILTALAPIDASNAAETTVRGQYRAGAIGGVAVKGYLDENGDPESRTETFVALKVGIENWRWAGVPFYLRTGKRLAEHLSEVVVTFRRVPHSIFSASAGRIEPTQLIIRLQPDESILLMLMIKEPGPGGMRLKRAPLDMSFAETFKGRMPEAYERLLLDVIRGDATLFMRRDEVEAAWRWIDPIRAAWEVEDEPPRPYMAGSWGPSAAVTLIERDGRRWVEDWPQDGR